MSSRLTLLLISVCLLCSSTFSFARALSANAEGAVVDDTTVKGAIAGIDDDDDFESSYITDFELADAPDPNLKKYKDPEFLKTEYKRGRMAFLFGQYDIAYKILLPLAKHGHAKSQATIGWMFHIGKGKQKDLGEALKWYQLAAKQNHPVALNNIGVFYEQGLFVGKSLKTAAKWYKESAEWGYPYAQYNLGILYHEGKGVKKNPKEAQFWLQIAALQGVTQAIDVLKKISGTVHDGKTHVASQSDTSGGPQWHSSKTKANETSANPHTSNQYKNIADRIKSTRSMSNPDSSSGDFLQPPTEVKKPSAPVAPKPDETGASESKSAPVGTKVDTHFKTGEQFDKWLSDAQKAQEKLAAKPHQMKTNSHILEIFNDDWVNARNKNFYTIQLIKGENLDALLAQARKQPMLKETAYYTSVENGKKWYNLVYGNFKDEKSATAEINNLPKSVKEWSPKVRQFSEVHSNMSLEGPKALVNKK